MNNIPENHPKDTRTSSEKEENIIELNILKDILEETIGSYALQNPQNIYDEDFKHVLRVLDFSRGLKNHKIILAPDGFIRCISPKFPSAILLEIHNALVAIAPSARKVDASPSRPLFFTRGLDGAEQCVVTARPSRLM